MKTGCELITRIATLSRTIVEKESAGLSWAAEFNERERLREELASLPDLSLS